MVTSEHCHRKLFLSGRTRLVRFFTETIFVIRRDICLGDPLPPQTNDNFLMSLWNVTLFFGTGFTKMLYFLLFRFTDGVCNGVGADTNICGGYPLLDNARLSSHLPAAQSSNYNVYIGEYRPTARRLLCEVETVKNSVAVHVRKRTHPPT